MDATLIRIVILPSLLTLLGARSWYLPRWLGWLPEFRVDSPEGMPRIDVNQPARQLAVGGSQHGAHFARRA